MDFWVVEFHNYHDNDHCNTHYIYEDDALRDACHDIEAEVATWDLYDPDFADVAADIKLHLSAKDWKKAIDAFNNHSSDADLGLAWYVEKHSFAAAYHNKYPNGSSIIFPDDDEEEDEPEDEDEDEEDDMVSSTFVPATDGATCRKCKTYNEYARADKSDMTYCCKSCKMFTDVFAP